MGKESIIEDLILLHRLVGVVNRAMIEEAFNKPLVLPSLEHDPSWLEVKSYIARHKSFLDTSEKKTLWKESRSSIQSRLRLVSLFKASIKGEETSKIYLFSNNSSENFKLLDSIVEILNDRGEISEKVLKLNEIIK